MRPYSAQRASVGTALPGLSRRAGSNAAFTARNISSSSGWNCTHIWLIFSTPTPCSPVMVPPTSMHFSSTSAANSSVRRSSSASFASNRISGCRLPSPARKGAVHAVVVGREAPDGRKRGLAAGPEAQPLGLVARRRHARRARALEHRLHAGDLVFHLFRRAVGFAQQDRRRLEVVACAHELLYRARRRLVPHFQAAREYA